jgi:hypothetical protein
VEGAKQMSFSVAIVSNITHLHVQYLFEDRDRTGMVLEQTNLDLVVTADSCVNSAPVSQTGTMISGISSWGVPDFRAAGTKAVCTTLIGHCNAVDVLAKLLTNWPATPQATPNGSSLSSEWGGRRGGGGA